MKHADSEAWGRDYTLNLGSDEEVAMADLAYRVATTILERHKTLVSVQLVSREEMYGEGYDDTMRRQPDIAAAREVLGFEPRRRFDDFIDELVTTAVGRHLREGGRVGEQGS